MNIGETWSISLPSMWSKVSSTKKTQRRNRSLIFSGQSWFGEKSVGQTACLQRYFIRSQYWNTAKVSFGSSRNALSRWAHCMSTEICIKLFTWSSRKYSTEIDDVYSRLSKFLSYYLQLSPQSRYMFDTEKLSLTDGLKFISREARDLLRIAPRIVIDLPEGRYLFKEFVKVKRWMDRLLGF